MMEFDSFLSERANFLYGHFNNICTRAIGEYSGELLGDVFEISTAAFNHFWLNSMELKYTFGFWPHIYFGLPAGHVVSVVYYGEPRFETEYRYGAPTGDSFMLASDRHEDSVMPGLRWPEIKAIAEAAPQLKPYTLLALLPAAGFSPDQEKPARKEIRAALAAFGFRSPAATELARVLAAGLCIEKEWYFDEQYGWINHDQDSARCPRRDDKGFPGAPDEFFSAFKDFTKSLGLN